MGIAYLQHIKDFGEKQTVIDRINNKGNYSKANCRWVTPSENNLNSSRACANRICEMCIKLRKLHDEGLGWRRISRLTEIAPSTVNYHLLGHPDYHKGRKIRRLTQTKL